MLRMKRAGNNPLPAAESMPESCSNDEAKFFFIDQTHAATATFVRMCTADFSFGYGSGRKSSVSTTESAADILARNIAFFERRTAPRTRPAVAPGQAGVWSGSSALESRPRP